MHEFHLAEALAEQVKRVVPEGAVVREVEVRVGPRQAIEPSSLQLCWEAAVHKTTLDGVALQVDAQPWLLTCDACGRQWTSRVPFVTCECGNGAPQRTGGDEIELVSITVEG